MNNRISQKLSNSQERNEGFTILKEYIWYYNFNLLPICQPKDSRNDGNIRKEDFRQVLKQQKSNFFFTVKNIEDIILEAPQIEGQQRAVYIKYAVLQNVIKSQPRPTTAQCLPNILCLHELTPEDAQIGPARSLYAQQIRNIWQTQEFFDCPNYDLQKLDLNLLRDEGKGESNEQNASDQAETAEEIMNQKMVEFTKLNNLIILENLEFYSINPEKQIKFSQDLYNVLKPRQKLLLTNQEVDVICTDVFQKKEKRILKHIFLEDFQLYFQDMLSPIQLKDDEKKIIYYWIWKGNNFREFTVKTLANFINNNHNQREKALIKLIATSNSAVRRVPKEKRKVPRLFREMVQITFSFGITFFENSIKPLFENSTQLNKGQLVDLTNLKIYFSSLEISFDEKELQEFQYFLTNRGILVLQDGSQQSFLASKIFIDAQKLISLIKSQAGEIALEQDQQGKKRQSQQQCRRVFQSKIIDQALGKLKKKIDIYQDEHDMIEEVRLRMLFAQSHPDLQQEELGHIFDNLVNVTNPSQYLAQRQIYIPELIEFLKSGPVFQQNYELNHTKLEEAAKLVSLPSEKGDNITALTSPKQKEDFVVQYGDQKFEIKAQQQVSVVQPKQKGPTHEDVLQEEVLSYLQIKSNEKEIQNYQQNMDEPIVKKTQSEQPWIRKESQFVTEIQQKSFTSKKVDETQIIEKFRDEMIRKFIHGDLESLKPFEKINKSCIDLQFCIMQLDQLNSGVIKTSQFIDFIGVFFPRIPLSERYQLAAIAQQLAVASQNDDQQDPYISYSFLCVQLNQVMSEQLLFDVMKT